MKKLLFTLITIITFASCSQTTKKTLNNENCITLDGNPTTGYTWEYTIENPIVEISEDVIYLGAENVTGAPSKFEYKLKALKPGKTTIDFIYHRPWEQEPPLQERLYMIIVDESYKISIESLPIK